MLTAPEIAAIKFEPYVTAGNRQGK